MFSFSHLHQLFNAEMCQSYIHALRWKDRSLQCPRCQSPNVGPWGTYHYQPALQRYRCKAHACKRTFNDLTGTLLDGSKRSVMHWILATFLLCLSVRATAGVGGCAMPPCPTRWRGRWRAPWKRMTSITPPATRGKRNRAGKDI